MKTFARGKGLESYLRSLHQHYKLLGRAVVMKAPEPVNITGKRGSKVFGIIGRAYWPDFFGYVCVPPHPVFVGGEAKESSHATRFQLSRIENSQGQALGRLHADGGVAWVWIRHLLNEAQRRDYLVPYRTIEMWLAEGHRSVTWSDLVPWRVPPGKGWIDAVAHKTPNGWEVIWDMFVESGWVDLPD